MPGKPFYEKTKAPKRHSISHPGGVEINCVKPYPGHPSLNASILSTVWENIFADDTSDEGLIFKI